MRTETSSIFDLDVYKLKMGSFIYNHFGSHEYENAFGPDATYKLIIRSFDSFTRTVPKHHMCNFVSIYEEAFHRYVQNIKKESLRKLSEQIQLSNDHCPSIDPEYLRAFINNMDRYILDIAVSNDYEPIIELRGSWCIICPFESYMMQLANKLYYLFPYIQNLPLNEAVSIVLDNDVRILTDHRFSQYKEFVKLKEKISITNIELLRHMMNEVCKDIGKCLNIPVIEYGSRRRVNSILQQNMIRYMIYTSKESDVLQLIGTSNLSIALQGGTKAYGTVGHEIFMGHLAYNWNKFVRGDYDFLDIYKHYNKNQEERVILTDTFNSRYIFDALEQHDYDDIIGSDADTRPVIFRHDSGPFIDFIQGVIRVNKHYDNKDFKILFSDGLTVNRMLDIVKYIGSQWNGNRDIWNLRDKISFGWGTSFHNPDFMIADAKCKDFSNPHIVVKLISCAGQGTVKLSEDSYKNLGDMSNIKLIKERLNI